jgi:hypothetical protein
MGYSAHYWCPPCNLRKIGYPSALLPASSAKPRKVAKNFGAVLPASSSKTWKVAKKSVSTVPLHNTANSTKTIGTVLDPGGLIVQLCHCCQLI